ncbi:Alpha/beta hydrolase fold-3 [Dillenia turbinata]|uniref:Alpha/beta hydrolase fold-3 n=1 Tax=Dillenia turbinata TaxID=194707 RepID=A0AAN8W4R3_9MAGN
MESTTNPEQEVTHEFRFFRVYKDGRVEKFIKTHKIPPSHDPTTDVLSKDAVVSTDPSISVRLFIPNKVLSSDQKLPLLFYIHGGGFSFESAFAPSYHNFMNTVVSRANLVGVSVEYGLFPERPIPACYDDSWAALQWVAAHVDGRGPEEWLNMYADFQRVFVAGDSAGGNISHTLATRVGKIGLPAGIKVVGVTMFHPYFGGTEDDHMWLFMCPTNTGLNDPRMKPDPADLAQLGCERLLIFVAELDHLRPVGIDYHEELKKSGWGGKVELVENAGEDHCFHLRSPHKHMEDLEVVLKFPTFFEVYKNGHVQRLSGTDTVPPSDDPKTGVRSKDVVICPETGLSARLFLPKTTTATQKFPLLVYYHGGAFCIQSAASPDFQTYHTALAAEANVVIVSIDYRLAPENPLPICYNDSWEAFQWVSSHLNGGLGGKGDAWLNDHADFSRVYLAGCSAGANIAHYVTLKAGVEGLQGMKIKGLALVHPYFYGDTEHEKDFVGYLYPSSPSLGDDLRLNPRIDPNLSKLGCERVLVCIAEKDVLRNGGLTYYEILKKNGWSGELKLFETQGEGHVFHVNKETCENERALELLKVVASFLE